MKIGDKVFLKEWKKSTSEERLNLLINTLEMPEELSGQPSETIQLINRFSDRLSPVHIFWRELAQAVDQAFPNRTLSDPLPLNRQIHQLRYVVSAFQAQWIRKHYRRIGDRDAEALARYLRTLRPKKLFTRRWRYDYDIRESARLHNKVLIGQSHKPFPVNIKVLIHFSTEFIISSDGDFVNEIDPEGQTLNGVVNGVSFNYASKNDSRHRELDILPTKPHDPLFRLGMMKQENKRYKSPTNLPLMMRWKNRKSWGLSYFNSKGFYAITGRSRYYHVRKQQRLLIHMIKGRR